MNKTFIPTPNSGSTLFGFNQSSSYCGEDKIIESEASRAKVNKWPRPLVFIKNIYLIANINLHVDVIGYNNFRKIHCLPFPHTKAQVTEFDLAVKYVKVNQGSSFEQTVEPRP